MDQLILRRLIFIRRFFELGVQQSYATPPLNILSLLHFHDAAELFLNLSAMYLKVSLKNDFRFMQYWDEISKRMPKNKELSHKDEMKKLNEARVNLKHLGMEPSQAAIEEYRSYTRGFFDDNAPRLFGIDFFTVSMVDLLVEGEVRTWLKQAEDHLATGKLEEALVLCGQALHVRMVNFGQSRIRRPRFVQPEPNVDLLYRWVTRELEQLNALVDSIYYGIEIGEATQITELLPEIMRSGSGTFQIRWKQGQRNPTRPDVERVHDFVARACLAVEDRARKNVL